MSTQLPDPVTIPLSATPRIPDHVVFRAFAAEMVLLNLNTGKYHGLSPSGGRMYEALARVDTLGAAAEEVAQEYGMPLPEIQRDLRELCEKLVERDLLHVEHG